MSHAFSTIRAARGLAGRQPEATAADVAVALVLATYADGHTGTRIFPGLDNVVRDTGLGRRTVQRCIARLVRWGELRQDNPARRGSAACFTWVGGMGTEPEPAPASTGPRCAEGCGRPADVPYRLCTPCHERASRSR